MAGGTVSSFTTELCGSSCLSELTFGAFPKIFRFRYSIHFDDIAREARSFVMW